ncbi:isochorismatase family protein [Microbispora sp. NPDC046933]|uniref:isochorismatase family protein n=1 Tax=Microbispora sp. NPDC046933 TaxID=3155618 RepID=UPI0033DB7A09
MTKRICSAFYGADLDLRLRRLGGTQLVPAGIATSIGVESTARAAHEHGYDVTLVTDAMTDRDAEVHRHSVERIVPLLGESGSTAEIIGLPAKMTAFTGVGPPQPHAGQVGVIADQHKRRHPVLPRMLPTSRDILCLSYRFTSKLSSMTAAVLETIWFTRCPMSTATGIAADQGRLAGLGLGDAEPVDVAAGPGGGQWEAEPATARWTRSMSRARSPSKPPCAMARRSASTEDLGRGRRTSRDWRTGAAEPPSSGNYFPPFLVGFN